MDRSRYGRARAAGVSGALLLAGLVLMVRGFAGELRDESGSAAVVTPAAAVTTTQAPAQANGTPAATPRTTASAPADQVAGDGGGAPPTTPAAPTRASAAPTATPSATPSAAAGDEAAAPRGGDPAPAHHASIGVTGDPIPAVPDSAAGMELSWRFPSPPHPAYRDRPFILVRGSAIDAPEDWMREQASALIERYHRYRAALREALYERTTAPLEGLADLSILNDLSGVVDRARVPALRYELQPSDAGVLVIDFEGNPGDGASAVMYAWEHTPPVKIWNLTTEQYVYGSAAPGVAVTGHLLPSWRMGAAGEWLLEGRGAPTRAGEHSQRFITQNGPQFLPYYQLNVEAREAADLPSVDDVLAQ